MKSINERIDGLTKLLASAHEEIVVLKKGNGALKELIICTDNLHHKIIALIKSLKKYKEFEFKFLFDPDVPYENNTSERAVRNLK